MKAKFCSYLEGQILWLALHSPFFYWKSHRVLELSSSSSSANPILEIWATSVSHCHRITGFLATPSCPAALCGSLQACCGASRWHSWPFATLQLSRQSLPSCHHGSCWVGHNVEPWIEVPRLGCPGPLSPLSGLVLLDLCFIEPPPWHTLLGEAELSPIEDPRSALRESVLLPILSGTAHASASKKSCLWPLLCTILTRCLLVI